MTYSIATVTSANALKADITVTNSQIKGSVAQLAVSGSTLTLTSPDGTTSTATLPASTSTSAGGGLTLTASRIASV